MKRHYFTSFLAVALLFIAIPFPAVFADNGWETDLNGLTSTSNKPADITYSENGVHISGDRENDALAMSKTKTSGNFIFESDVKITGGNVANLIFGGANSNSSEESFVFKLDKTNRNETKVFCFSTSRGYPTIASNNGAKYDLGKSDYRMKIVVIDNSLAAYVDDMLVCTSALPSYYKDGYIGIGSAEHSAVTFQNTRLTDLGAKQLAKITDISIEGMILTPQFSVSETNYGVIAVPFETESVNIIVTLSEGEGELTVGGKQASGGAPVSVPLEVGKNVITILLKDGVSGAGVPITVSVTRKNSSGKYMTEDYRDQYHFSPLEGWMNDPNGLIWLNGRWHMFYQYIPLTTAESGSEKHWGHAVSDDLVHWEELPVALAPDEIGAIWSGSTVADPENRSGLFEGKSGNNLVAFFTHRSDSNVQVQSMAYSSDGGLTWTKYENNPVLSRADDPLSNSEFRDPNVFWCEKFGRFVMVVAGGPLRIYSSADLINWEFESGYDNEHPSYRPSGVGSIYSECPDLFPLTAEGEGDLVKWIYTGAGEWYMIGELERIDGKIAFIPDSMTRYSLKFGYDAYAGVTFKNAPGGRVVMVSWMMNWGYAGSMPTDPWNGTFTLCYDLTLKRTKDGLRVFTDAVSEYDTLREDAVVSAENVILSEGSDDPLSDARSDCFELIAHLLPDKNTKEVGFDFLAGNNYKLTVKYDPKSSRLTVDRSNVSSVRPGSYGSLAIADQVITKNSDGSVDIRIFVDRGSAEVIANNGETYTALLVFPDTASVGMSAYSLGGSTTADITVYPLSSVYRSEESNEIKGVYLDICDGCTVGIGERFTVHSRVLYAGADQRVKWSTDDPDGAIRIVSQDDYCIILETLKAGSFSLTASTYDGSAKTTVRLTSSESSFKTNLTGWKTSGVGTWEFAGAGYSGLTSGDGFSVSEETFNGDFMLSLDVTFKGGTAFGIVFCSKDDPAQGSYMVNFDVGNSEQGQKFRWTEFPYRGGTSDNAVMTFRKSTTPKAGKTYHIDMSFIDGKLTYIFDGITIFDGVADKDKSAAFKSGHIGIMGCSSEFTVDNMYVYTGNLIESIALSEGTLLPAFDPAVTGYTADLQSSSDNVSLTVGFKDGAKVSLNGTELESGVPSDPVRLSAGTNTLELKVKFAGIETVYTISVAKDSEAENYYTDDGKDDKDQPIKIALPIISVSVCVAVAAAVITFVTVRKKSGKKKPEDKK